MLTNSLTEWLAERGAASENTLRDPAPSPSSSPIKGEEILATPSPLVGAGWGEGEKEAHSVGVRLRLTQSTVSVVFPL